MSILLDVVTHTFVAAVPTVAFWRAHRRIARQAQENRNLRTLVASSYTVPVYNEEYIRRTLEEALRYSVPLGVPATAKVTVGTRSGGSISFEVRK